MADFFNRWVWRLRAMDGNCRAFVAGVTAGESKSMLQGVGCQGDDGEIALDGVGPWKGL